ncbi:acyltransferase family protein [Cellulomonas sp. HZM]|uniref:acyltransferase family protein n=1 Tax=Cellulomonas sp. HZM TaxID=1454010 RepID=UPI00068971B4|nr:acyltransferase family protein [Cellulomonas sp. HZM]
MTTTEERPAAATSRTAADGGFRPDIQGLRAVAVLLVLAFHAGVTWLPGGFVGVDVFFVVSGFLITSMLVGEVTATGRLRLGRFYARRARRLLPAAATVLVAVALATMLWLPVTRWREIAGDVGATALYVVNWRLADRSVDYLAQGSAASPVQHFWSLAVEEQFYVVWPLVVLAVASWARRRGLRVGRPALGVAAVLVVGSLAWSVHLTASDPARAYFVTTTRAWELGLGALLAVGAPVVAGLPARVLAAAGWAGLALVAYAALRFTGSTPFPGAAALVPTVGTALVLAAGTGAHRGLSALRLRALQPVGSASYSLYLWHWPAVVVATALWSGEDGSLPVPIGVAAVAASAVPAALAYRWVERPLHVSARLRASVRRSALLGVACTCVGVLAAVALVAALPRSSSAAAPGAAVLADGSWTGPDARTDLTAVAPALADATSDVADLYADGCHQNSAGTAVVACTYGDAGSSTVVALVGDSHAAQWQPALRVVAEQHGWRLDTYTKGSCALADVQASLGDDPYTTCSTWNRAVTAALVAHPPTVVVTTNDAIEPMTSAGERATGGAAAELAADGLARTWQRLTDAGSRVVAIADTPWVGIDVPECVATHQRSWATACTVDAAAAERRSGTAQQEAAARATGVPVVDLTALVCPAGTCPAIIGEALVWRDAHHLTATYDRTLAPALAEQLVPLVG